VCNQWEEKLDLEAARIVAWQYDYLHWLEQAKNNDYSCRFHIYFMLNNCEMFIQSNIRHAKADVVVWLPREGGLLHARFEIAQGSPELFKAPQPLCQTCWRWGPAQIAWLRRWIHR